MTTDCLFEMPTNISQAQYEEWCITGYIDGVPLDCDYILSNLDPNVIDMFENMGDC